MHEITLIVTMQVSDDGSLTEDEAKIAARDSVDEALNYGMNRGFNHGYTDVASVGYVCTEVFEEE